jgi:hypothetical protein
MDSENSRELSLREMELEVEAEGCEWMWQRLEKELQTQADRLGGVFPPQRARQGWHRRAQSMHLRSALDQVELVVAAERDFCAHGTD